MDSGLVGEECDPKLNNGVPCVCIYRYSIIVTAIEFMTFIGCLVTFLIASFKKRQKLDFKSCILISLFLCAFTVRIVYLGYSYAGPNKCRKIQRATSYVCFIPQAIFFLIFIWVIFKLLIIWRLMVSQSQSQQMKERKRLRVIQLVYFLTWVILWAIQRTAEYLTIDFKINHLDQSVDDTIRKTLVSSNIIELLMELCLYAWLIHVSFVLGSFLKSFDETTAGSNKS